MKHLCFISPSKATLEGKSLTKFDIAQLIDRIVIFRYTNPDYYTKPELISVLRNLLCSPTYETRVKRLNICWI